MTGTTTPDMDARGAAPRAGATGARGKGGASALTPEIQNRIGSHLQSLYKDLLAESTPDRFLKLLDELDRKP